MIVYIDIPGIKLNFNSITNTVDVLNNLTIKYGKIVKNMRTEVQWLKINKSIL